MDRGEFVFSDLIEQECEWGTQFDRCCRHGTTVSSWNRSADAADPILPHFITNKLLIYCNDDQRGHPPWRFLTTGAGEKLEYLG